ncbi:hypothetical protein AY599_27450 [Leptolyngbya valderiana BDU 20041]|nr:tetratricopeptide repeat protein [Geitlerinema sp. CS-897]OAB54927.1 hypothetical protein AY599_27450 [Leptolyngbya valderiana BDU 20041]PPT05518.1 hypothetical protein CKA32_006099 [Geitlerinema sp. FC II]PPT06705.1 TPR domain protein putative component of TonB system [Geitlerinema sp. FC II]
MNLNPKTRIALTYGSAIVAFLAVVIAFGPRSLTENLHPLTSSTTRFDSDSQTGSWWSKQIAKAKAEANPRYINAISQGRKNLEAEHYTDAIANFNQAVRLAPDNIVAYHGRALARLKVEDYNGAIADFTRILELDPDDVRAYGNRGSAYQKLGDIDKALSDYNRALELSPEYTFAYFNRGSLYVELGEYTKALQDFNQTVILEPEYAKAFYNRGMVYASLDDIDAAVADLETAEALFRKQNNFTASELALDAIADLK